MHVRSAYCSNKKRQLKNTTGSKLLEQKGNKHPPQEVHSWGVVSEERKKAKKKRMIAALGFDPRSLMTVSDEFGSDCQIWVERTPGYEPGALPLRQAAVMLWIWNILGLVRL
jgi:hypothetical protein